MDFNTIIMIFVGFLVSVVAYFLQRLVKTLDRIDTNVNQHTTLIATIQSKIDCLPDIELKLQDLRSDLDVIETEHRLTISRCQNARP